MRRVPAFFAALLLLLAPLLEAAQQPLDAAQLQLALQKLTVLGGAMYVAAHPDDENTAMLAWLANDRLYRTAYLSMTRGDGGQNLIGDEKGELLGVIRTQELLAARRIDTAEQYFTRALDFGYSKNPEETLAIWGHDLILSDVVWNIRRFQPDVLVTRFPTTGEGGHGHHTASAILAVEAFKAAGDPTKFPEQLRYVNVWQPRRIFWNRFSFGAPIKPDDPAVAKSLRVDLGTYNPLLGRAYTEIAAESRSQHKSQGFGSAERRGTILNYYDLLGGEPAQKDLFEGIDTSWSRYPGGETVGAILHEAVATYDPKDPARSIPVLLRANDALDRLETRPEWSAKVNPWIGVKRTELQNAIRAAAGIAVDIAATDSSTVPGGEVKLNVTVVNRSPYPFNLSTVGSRYGNPSVGVNKALKNNEPVKTELSIKLPADFPYSQPYWLTSAPSKGAFTVRDQQLIGLPENPPSIPVIVTIEDPTHSLFFSVPAVYRWTDAVKGEQTRPVDVEPDYVANLASRVYIFGDAKPKNVSVSLQSFAGAGTASVHLQVPEGWSASPVTVPVKFANKGDEQRATFSVTPPAHDASGQAAVEVTTADGHKLSYSLTNIDYPHIPAQRILGDAVAKLVRVDVKKRGTRIGYIMGPGDEVPEALRQVGYDVTLLTDADLERGDFARFDAIVTGIRVYNTRQRIRLAQPKLMQYVENGGTLVVQYNSTSPQPLLLTDLGPYPFTISSERVTVEEAPVTMLKPEHPLLNTPNKITAADWLGWVQERGLYFPNKWDDKYETLIATHDPGEPEKPGGELFARYGKGAFIYTSYSWFRQLPAGVPGAYKLFANMVSAK
ncbi:MAG: LmbE family protein [Acidobacteria bacterium]|nr:LmbE family protein [Acidobacteriota bacterium]